MIRKVTHLIRVCSDRLVVVNCVIIQDGSYLMFSIQSQATDQLMTAPCKLQAGQEKQDSLYFLSAYLVTVTLLSMGLFVTFSYLAILFSENKCLEKRMKIIPRNAHMLIYFTKENCSTGYRCY